MNAIQVCEAAKHQGVQLFRQRKNAPGEYDCKSYFDGGHKRGWVVMDSFTGSAVMAVYEGLNETNRARFASLPMMIFKKDRVMTDGGVE